MDPLNHDLVFRAEYAPPEITDALGYEVSLDGAVVAHLGRTF